jgi:hypothetical protein
MSKTYEMMWNCSYCDTKNLLGKSHKHCPNCGTAQDPNKRFYPSDDEKVAVEDHEYVGKDKLCGFCEAPNSAIAKFCTECAGPMDGTKDVQLVQNPTENPAPKKSKTTTSGGKWIAVVFIIIAIVIGLLFMEEEKEVTVTGHSWERSIDIEEYKQVTEEAWEDRIPSKGKIKTCRDKERDTKKVADGEECSLVKKDNGDGTYNESEKCTTKYKSIPIYDDWCIYEIKKWTVVRTPLVTDSNLSPIWPPTSIKACQMTALHCEREGTRKEAYRIHLADQEGDNHTCDFSEMDWKNIKVGTGKIMSFGSVTGNIDCDTWGAQ